jgi:hypothetical protein
MVLKVEALMKEYSPLTIEENVDSKLKSLGAIGELD